jgi:hypothetical protein
VRALPLWQPWASLVAIGAKRVETRHWPTPPRLIGERIAIHATKTKAHLAIGGTEPFRSALLEHYPQMISGLPLGAIVATAVVARCAEITSENAAELERRDPVEFAFGDYTPGRFAWVLRDIEQLEAPIPFKGAQGIFTVPDHLISAAARQGAML